MADWWLQNWEKVLTVVSCAFGFVGVHLALKGWKRKKPTYLVHSNNIFSGLEHTVPDVEVKFPGYGQPIKALTVSKIGFWNAGTDAIRKHDVVKEDPITIRGKEGVVFLSASIIEAVAPLNKINCRVNHDRSLVAVSFEYLDRNQGANIQVFHTGTKNSDLTMHGTIMGTSGVRRVRRGNDPKPPPPWWFAALPLSVLWLLWLLAAFGAVTLNPPQVEVPPPTAIPFSVVTYSLLGLTAVICFVMYFFHIPRPFSHIYRTPAPSPSA